MKPEGHSSSSTQDAHTLFLHVPEQHVMVAVQFWPMPLQPHFPVKASHFQLLGHPTLSGGPQVLHRPAEQTPIAHWESETHGPHAPVVVLHTDPTVDAAQSALLEQNRQLPPTHLPVEHASSFGHDAQTPLTQ
jgi:hypothetical protein